MIKIETITPDLAEALCRKITADLPEYFGLPEVNAHYAMGVRSRVNLGACADEEYVGGAPIILEKASRNPLLDSYPVFS